MASAPSPVPSEKAESPEKALEREDAVALSRSLSLDDLKRLKAAEMVVEMSHRRKQRTSWIGVTTQSLVGLVAIGGFFANAYQSYINKQQQQLQRATDQARWEKEFTRASLADKYRAFFETSVLATDPTNADKRLVGYALLQEFVSDSNYNGKATLMLEESLSQELRGNKVQGLDEAHRNAVVAIVTALSQTTDCDALERAARSIDRVARRHAQEGDMEETREVLGIYIRRLMGRSTVVCRTMKEFQVVRRPIRDTVLRNPEVLGGAKGLHATQANELLARVMRDRCGTEASISGASDCPDIIRGYERLCEHEQLSAQERQEEGPACEVIRAAVASLPKAAAPTAAQTSP